jgi:hypothetical protein
MCRVTLTQKQLLVKQNVKKQTNQCPLQKLQILAMAEK